LMPAGYRVLLTSRALKELKALPRDVKQIVGKGIDKLAREGRGAGVKKLGGAGWRLRVGDYRILFEVDDKNKVITIYRIRHRREAYR